MKKSGVYVHKSWRDRLALALPVIGRSIRFAATGEWEGSEVNRLRRRPPVRLVAQDTDLDFGTREALISEARDIVQKYGLGKRILRQFANYVVGQCRVQWLTEDEEWNDQAEEMFCAWSQMPDYRGVLSLRKMARLAVISRKRDGDVFFIERNDGGLYTLEAIEADRVGNISGVTNTDTEKIIGGVHVDSRGRPIAYRVLKRGRYGVFTDPVDIPRWQIIHFFDSDRFDAYRGVTAFHVALNDLRDLKEAKTAEQLKQKLASKLALLVKNATGSPMAGVDPFQTTEDAKGNTVTSEDVGDVAIKYLFNGDSMEAFKSDSPGDSWFRLTELIIRDIAIGLDLPFEFVWNMASLTGPGTRMMSKQAERTFVSEQDDLEEQFFNRVIARWVSNEMAEGRLPINEDAACFKIQRPSHPSIDGGRDSASNINERQGGLMSGGAICSERGEDIYDVHQEIERESDDKLMRAKRLADKHKIPMPVALSLMGVSAYADVLKSMIETTVDAAATGGASQPGQQASPTEDEGGTADDEEDQQEDGPATVQPINVHVAVHQPEQKASIIVERDQRGKISAIKRE